MISTLALLALAAIDVADMSCLGVAPPQLARMIQLELPDGVEGAMTVRPRCTATEAAIEWRRENDVRTHVVPLSGVAPTARARTLALAIAEWSRASPVADFETVRRSAWILRAGAWSRHLFAHGDTLIGAQAGVGFDVGPFTLGVDAGAATTRTGSAIGEVQLGLAALGLSVTLTRDAGPYRVFIGPRIEPGLGWVSGSSERDDVDVSATTDFIFTAGLQAGLQIRLSERWLFGLQCMGGGVVRGLDGTGDGETVTGLSGSVASLALSIGGDVAPR